VGHKVSSAAGYLCVQRHALVVTCNWGQEQNGDQGYSEEVSAANTCLSKKVGLEYFGAPIIIVQLGLL
jgi:hypothetical protein